MNPSERSKLTDQSLSLMNQVNPIQVYQPPSNSGDGTQDEISYMHSPPEPAVKNKAPKFGKKSRSSQRINRD